MINAMSRELQDRLQARKFPIRVYYDSDRFERNPDRTCVVVQRDVDSSDKFSYVTGLERNTRRKAIREIAVRVNVFAKNNVTGARRADHECLSDQIVDAVHCALLDWGTEKKMPVTFGDGRFLSAEELNDSLYTAWPGTVYTINLTVKRGVPDQDFDGNGLTEVALDRVTTTQNVS